MEEGRITANAGERIFRLIKQVAYVLKARR
jgi:hypothetical protein